jgi:NTP pyrophosphatase (non-canonical NTP hydrolase)
MSLQPSQLRAYHKLSSHHRDDVLRVAYVSCFYCLRHFSPKKKKIKEWCDGGQTAICPYCGIDAILPTHMGTEALQDMHDHWFSVAKGKSYQMRKGKAMAKIKASILEEEKVDINQLAYKAHAMAVEKGFWDDLKEEPGRLTSIGAKIALIHSEVSEAIEEYRNGHPLDETRIEDGKPEGFGVELADVIIRVCDLAERAGVNLGACINLKMRYNETRPTRHGGKLI